MRARGSNVMGAGRLRPYGTMVICEACTSKGLYSPVRPCESFAETVKRTIPIGASFGTTHFATQNSRSG